MLKPKQLLLIPSLFFLTNSIYTQSILQNAANDPLEIHGNFNLNSQYYLSDSVIAAPTVAEKFLINGYANVIATKGAFSAGARYESYENALLGFDPRYKGSGFPYRYFSFVNKGLNVTVGNFYEQFGTGMLLRSYEERDLGLDNAMDGIRVKYDFGNGIRVKGLVGRQRYFFAKGDGIVRAIDGEVNLNEAIGSWKDNKLKLLVGANFVSKYQEDNNPDLVLPENVGAYSGRITARYANFSLTGEYAYKENDPSADNRNIYKPGQGLFVSASYSKKGFGINLSAKHIDNMSFRSDRTEGFNNLTINYLPALTKQHTYNLAATLYPYATQPTGEVAFQGDIVFRLKKKTWYGGKYGTRILINSSLAYGLDSTRINDQNTTRQGYSAKFFSPGSQAYFQDINISLERKLNKTFKVKAMYMNMMVNNLITRYGGLNGSFGGKIYADIAVLDVMYKIRPKHALRAEFQALWSDQDMGDWGTVVLEYTYSPHWFVAIIDQYNYGNNVEKNQIHYPYGTFGYINGGNRVSLGFGRQKAGLFCVGGVCRVVPASNGLTITVTSSF